MKTINEKFKITSKHARKDVRKVGSSGFIVLKKDSKDNYKILALVTKKGKFDTPKGGIEDKESPIEAAFRELEEEAGITSVTFNWGLEHIIINEQLLLFLGITNQKGNIKRNPETGKFEHEGIAWVTFDEMSKNCLDHLLPAVLWAKANVFHMTKDNSYKLTKTERDIALSSAE